MAAPLPLPPSQYIALAPDLKLAAENDGESNVLTVDKFDRKKPQQLFSILPDGRIRLSNGKFTAPGFYESEVQIVERESAYHWTIIWSTTGFHTIHHKNGNAWTFGDPYKPIEIAERRPDKKGQQFRFIYGYATGAQPDEPDDPEEPIQAKAAKKVLITGARGNIQGGIPSRLEIHDFVKNEKFFSLYVQALRELQRMAEDDVISYYQICGLHGFPLVHWNQSNVGSGSYCKHGTNVFPTWHRPYVALFEQILQQHALAIARTYRKDRDKWVKAASDLRQPFWDWARPGGATPPDVLLSRQTLRILTPRGYRNVENPFLYYRYQSERSTATFPSQFIEWTRTIRDPYNDTPDQDIRERTANAQEELTMKTHDLFELDSWEEFSNKAQTQKGSTNSLEALHDSIHVLVGRNGHFASPCAAFDALFYLHHSQVDRLLSLWATLHDKWVPEPNVYEDLAPFWIDENSYWNSDKIRRHEIFNYTYPEYQGVSGDLRTHIRDAVDKLYGDPTKKIFKPLDSGQTSSIQSWSIRIRIKPFEIDQSFSVVVFLDQVPKDPHTWLKSPDLVGSYQSFIVYLPEDCENCREHEHVPIEGFVHLTSALQEPIARLGLKTERQVSEFLEKNLHLGLQKVDGTLVDLTEIQFEAKVVSRNISKAASRDPSSKLNVGGAKHYDFNIKPGALFFPN